MTEPTTPDLHDNTMTEGDGTSARLDQLRALLETVEPAEAREAISELMLLSAPGDGGEALKLAVRFSSRADCSTDELIGLWATADDNPYAFSQDLQAPAYWARKAVQNLVRLSTPGDGGEPLKLAARFIHKDKYASKMLFRLWSTAHDADAFVEHLLAPAFRQAGETELELGYVSSLTGLRHLTMLTSLSIGSSKSGTDFTEVGELTGLTNLSITSYGDIESLTPIGRLAQLTRLSLAGWRQVEDIEPLLNLSRLRELDLSWTNVRSAHGFSQAFPLLESLNLNYCQSFTDVDGLAGLRSLTHLKMHGSDQLRDLSPFAAFPRLESLSLNNCAELTTLEGLGIHPRLTKLGIHEIPRLHTLEGIGEQPALRDVSLTGCPALTDLSALGRLPALHKLLINHAAVRNLDGIGEQPALRDVSLIGCPALTDLSGLGRLPALHKLLISDTAVRNLDGLAGSPLCTLTLRYMRHLDSLGSLRECPGLQELTLSDDPRVKAIPADLSLEVAELRDRGVTVLRH